MNRIDIGDAPLGNGVRRDFPSSFIGLIGFLDLSYCCDVGVKRSTW